MKKKIQSTLFVFVITLFLTQCAYLGVSTVHDQILTYEVPYDRAFMQILEAVNQLEGWSIESTNKAEGLITMRKPGALGERVILIVKNLDKRLISVELARSSRMAPGVDVLLGKVDESLLEKMPEAQE